MAKMMRNAEDGTGLVELYLKAVVRVWRGELSG